MTKDHSFTRGRIVAATGVPNDVLTFWLRSGLIVPTNAVGQGLRLRFKPGQVRIAALLKQARHLGLNLDAMRALASALQVSEDWIAENGIVPSDWSLLVEEKDRRIRTPEFWMQSVSYFKERGQFKTAEEMKANAASDLLIDIDPRISLAVDSLSLVAPNVQSLVLAILVSDYNVAMYRDEDGAWFVDTIVNIEGGLPAPYCVLFDLSKIYKTIDWNAA